MFMPLARLAQYQHCLLRRNDRRTVWSNDCGTDAKKPLSERLSELRAQWLNVVAAVDSEPDA